MFISFPFSLWGCYMGPIWATHIWAYPYGTHAEPGCTPHMGSPYGTHIGMFAGYRLYQPPATLSPGPQIRERY